MKRSQLIVPVVALFMTFTSVSSVAEDQPLLINIKRMSMETALRIAQAGIKECRKQGVQVAITVIDRGGHAQAVLRDVLAPDITLTISKQKAYTAMAFNSTTSNLEGRFKSPFSVGKVEGLIMSPGGVPIQVGGTLLGGVGVSGAPSGEVDEKCAKAGVDAVAGDLELAD